MTAAALLSERPVERGPRGAQRPFLLEEFLGTQVRQQLERASSPIGKLEHLERELADLLERQAPTTWRAQRRALWRVMRAARRELMAVDRAELRELAAPAIAAPGGAQQPARRKIPAGRGAR